MKAINDFRGFAATAETVAANDRRPPFSRAHVQPQLQMHNARGFVLAVAMSAACWAGVALAFLL
ncbi:hypothetical protein HNO88_003447 [Novosphingobium chloroacetimidivorans]|uniref:Uncharacterized protein n=1 Tax=Novosphingobium chloroacetimidivorans TaxID=1428314 RepID=A0A7W7NX70_9SPHN|nr:hypothetical protein [Novosphingobium chloroacetimidivorans]MBB4860106.1 hypothetical protein [Novosphingobium chloroacetimidivorans]